MDHPADKVRGFAAIFALFPQMLEIGTHFEHFGKPRFARFLRADQFYVARPIGPFGQLAAIFPREIKQQCEHLRGQFNRDEIDPVKNFTDRERIQQFGRATANINGHAVHFTGCECRRDNPAFFGMLWPVHRNEHRHDHPLVFGNRFGQGVVVNQRDAAMFEGG